MLRSRVRSPVRYGGAIGVPSVGSHGVPSVGSHGVPRSIAGPVPSAAFFPAPPTALPFLQYSKKIDAMSMRWRWHLRQTNRPPSARAARGSHRQAPAAATQLAAEAPWSVQGGRARWPSSAACRADSSAAEPRSRACRCWRQPSARAHSTQRAEQTAMTPSLGRGFADAAVAHLEGGLLPEKVAGQILRLHALPHVDERLLGQSQGHRQPPSRLSSHRHNAPGSAAHSRLLGARGRRAEPTLRAAHPLDSCKQAASVAGLSLVAAP